MKLGVLAAVLLLSVVAADAASACAVCFGAEGSKMSEGLNNGILTLLGVVGFVQAGFVALFGSIWYRSRRLQKLRERFQLIEGKE